jgi:aldehyde dehydrogenase (NAD+)
MEWRVAQLDGLERLVSEHEGDIAAALADDLGRSAAEAWIADINPSLGEIVFARKHLKKWMRPRRTRLPLTQLPARGWIQYEPLGVVLVISPWNYPFYLALSPVVGAIAAGNCVVVKPSEVAPATSALLADLVPKYLDPEAVVVVEGDGETSQALLAQGFDHVLFTGGTEIGRKILAGAAPTLTPVTLELGGKSPVIVAADADLGVAARRIAWLKLMNSGQTCLARSRSSAPSRPTRACRSSTSYSSSGWPTTWKRRRGRSPSAARCQQLTEPSSRPSSSTPTRTSRRCARRSSVHCFP